MYLWGSKTYLLVIIVIVHGIMLEFTKNLQWSSYLLFFWGLIDWMCFKTENHFTFGYVWLDMWIQNLIIQFYQNGLAWQSIHKLLPFMLPFTTCFTVGLCASWLHCLNPPLLSVGIFFLKKETLPHGKGCQWFGRVWKASKDVCSHLLFTDSIGSKK